jgi:hypothetical protein
MRCTAALVGLIGLIALCRPVFAPAQQDELPLRDLLATATGRMALECERLLEPQSFSSELAEREAQMSAAVYCDCMPLALEGLGRARGSQSFITGAEFAALVLGEFDVCGARAVRDSARRDCAKFIPPNAPPMYCECFSAAVDGLTDEQIVEDSIASRDNLEQRVTARRNSTPEAPLYESLLARIDKQCRVPSPAQ